MKFLPLVWRSLMRRKLRTLFTALSIVVAFLLFGALMALKAAFGMGVDLAGQDRLVMIQKVSFIQPLPRSYQGRIAASDGITAVTHQSWFGGIYQDPKNFFAQFAVEPAPFLQMYPEYVLAEDRRQAWYANRTGAIVGRALADRFGWKVGDRVPLQATIFRKADDSPWTFTIEGIYEAAKGTDTTQFLFHYDYLNETRTILKDEVGWYIVRVSDPQQSDAIAGRLDAMFANSSAETKTSTEKAFVQAFAKQIGDIGSILMAILAAVLFTMLLVAANTMGQAVRERTSELAVMKTLGFTDGHLLALVLLESVLLATVGGGTGLLLAWLITQGGDPTGGLLPAFFLPTRDLVLGVGLVLVLGMAAGLLPAWQASRLRIVDALRRQGVIVMQALSQVLAITLVNIRSIPQRLGSSVVAIVGIAGVVVVFVSVLSIAQGFRAAMTTAGDPRTAIVLRAGTDSEMSSGLSREQTQIIKDAPGLARGADGPVASAELFVIVNHPKRSTGTDANVPLRGVEAGAFAVRPRLKMVEGRRFAAGRNEIVVGRAAVGQFSGLEVGNEVRWGENAWKVVGIFEAGGAISESEIWCDARVLQGAYRRGDSFQSVYVQLEREDSLEAFRSTLTRDPRLNVMVERETDYLAAQSTVLQTIIRTVGYVIAGLMGIGAVFGAINTMYNAVASRTREIATLRALGFGAVSIVASVMAESAVLALLGGVLGGLLSWVFFDGYRTSTMNFQSFSQVAFAFRVTPTLLAQGLACAVVMGLLGGILPAIRAARLPIVNALREL